MRWKWQWTIFALSVKHRRAPVDSGYGQIRANQLKHTCSLFFFPKFRLYFFRREKGKIGWTHFILQFQKPPPSQIPLRQWDSVSPYPQRLGAGVRKGHAQCAFQSACIQLTGPKSDIRTASLHPFGNPKKPRGRPAFHVVRRNISQIFLTPPYIPGVKDVKGMDIAIVKPNQSNSLFNVTKVSVSFPVFPCPIFFVTQRRRAYDWVFRFMVGQTHLCPWNGCGS